MARLGIALISFANGTAALCVPKVLATTGSGVTAAIELASGRIMDVKVQRLPRVPRRERFEGDRAEALVAGSGE